MGVSRRQRGVSLIEFTLTLPIFLFVLMATMDFSWYISKRYDVQRAAQVGARVASTVLEGADPDGEEIKATAELYALGTLEAAGIECEDICDVDAEWVSKEGYMYVRVAIAYPYPSLVPGLRLTPSSVSAQFTMLTQQQII